MIIEGPESGRIYLRFFDAGASYTSQKTYPVQALIDGKRVVYAEANGSENSLYLRFTGVDHATSFMIALAAGSSVAVKADHLLETYTFSLAGSDGAVRALMFCASNFGKK
jgi:hypothetical protein